nr:hypothetical protein [Tanacetum cinerariifolium]
MFGGDVVVAGGADDGSPPGILLSSGSGSSGNVNPRHRRHRRGRDVRDVVVSDFSVINDHLAAPAVLKPERLKVDKTQYE